MNIALVLRCGLKKSRVQMILAIRDTALLVTVLLQTMDKVQVPCFP